MSYNKEYLFKGLSCPNCAGKIEKAIEDLPGVIECKYNLINEKMSLNLENKDININKKDLQSLVDKIEDGVTVKETKEEEGGNHDEHHHHHHEGGVSKKLIMRLVATMIILIMANIIKIPNVKIILFLISYLIIGYDVVGSAVKNIIKGEIFDENFLMSIATVGAFIIGEYPEAVAVMVFYQIGELFQNMAVSKSRKSIADLMDIRPDYANLKVGNETKKVNPKEVKIGDIIEVLPGEKVPLDGMVTSGNASMDTSMLTGESLPIDIGSGGDVIGGYINKDGVIEIKVTKSYGESTISKILALVENASNKKASAEKFITKFAKVYTPSVVFLAAILAVVPPTVTGSFDYINWIERALIFLVVSCPCALVVSVPLTFFGGVGAASKNGILVKGGNYLEALSRIEVMVFDKTGTLTKGKFTVFKVVNNSEYSDEEFLKLVAHGESFSNHPIAKSIVEFYKKDIDKNIVSDYKEVAGHGISANIHADKVLLGNINLFKDNEVEVNQVDEIGTVIYVALNNKFSGYIVISDEIKPDSKEAIKGLRDKGIETVMLTGDNKKVAENIGNFLGLDTIHSELLPNEKVSILEKIFQNKKDKEGNVAFIGDGINDAPVIARADIGFAMGGIGSDAAIEAADVVIMNDEPSKVLDAINIAKYTRKIVVQNILFALGVKFIILIISTFGYGNMWEAVFADVGVTLIAVFNAMRTLRYKLR